jgi:hypothetical protein
MPQWETTTPKFLVNKTVSSTWSHSHRKSLYVRPPQKNWIPRYQVWAVWWLFQHIPPKTLQPHCRHLAVWGVARSCSITPRLSHLWVPSSNSFSQPVQCAAATLTVLLLDRKLGLWKSLLREWPTGSMQLMWITWFPAGTHVWIEVVAVLRSSMQIDECVCVF